MAHLNANKIMRFDLLIKMREKFCVFNETHQFSHKAENN